MAKVKFGTSSSKKPAVNLSKEKAPVFIEKEKIVNHFVEKRIEVPTIEYVNRDVEVFVPKHTIEYKTVEIPVEKIVEIVKIVEKPIEVIKEVKIEVPIEKIVYVTKEIEKPIYIDKYIENRELMKKLSDTQKSLTKFKYISGLLLILAIAGLIYGK